MVHRHRELSTSWRKVFRLHLLKQRKDFWIKNDNFALCLSSFINFGGMELNEGKLHCVGGKSLIKVFWLGAQITRELKANMKNAFS